MLIYGDIGEQWDAEESLTAKTVAADLAGIAAGKIDVRINSYGGAVADGLAIFNALRRHPAAVTTHIDGVAFSTASLIAMAGDTVRMAKNALLMIHAPWGAFVGNAADLRRGAESLDRYAQAAASSYVRDGGPTYDAILALLQDGEDHFYTAEEAAAAGIVDEIDAPAPVADRYDLSRYPSLPLAAAAFTLPENRKMPEKTSTLPPPEAPDIAEIQSAAEARERLRITARNADLQNAYARHMGAPGVPELYAAQLADPVITVEAAQAALLNHLGAQSATPLAGQPRRVESVLDSREKFRAAAGSWLGHRMGLNADDAANELRGHSLSQIAARALNMAGQSAVGLTKRELAARVLAAHTTSDFPYLLQDAANKRLQAAYSQFPATWRDWCAVGEVSDFKTVNLIRIGSFNSLATIAEGDEYTAGTIGEERETLTAVTKGKFIQLGRQMIINDDLGGFSRMAQLLGNAAARTITADVYGILNANAAMSDGYALASTDHANLSGSSAAISVATLSAARGAMRKQRDPNGRDYLDIRPRFLLCPVVKEDAAREVVASPGNIATAGSSSRNPIRDWGPLDVISDPYLDGGSTTAWYLVADPMQAPVVEVHFLDGVQLPYTDTDAEWLTDAIRWKVRLDYGVAANDWRGLYKNAGA